jgi:hypothetical protein
MSSSRGLAAERKSVPYRGGSGSSLTTRQGLPAGEAVGGDRPRDHTPGTDRRTSANLDSRQDDCATTNPGPVANSHRLGGGQVALGSTIRAGQQSAPAPRWDGRRYQICTAGPINTPSPISIRLSSSSTQL